MTSISIIVPTYNRKEQLKRCLEYLDKQTLPVNEYEIIIVDDGSTDNTPEIINKTNNKKNIRYFFQENKGPAAARNLGISKAKGEIIAFTDDDCILDKDWLHAIDKAFKENPDVSCVKGMTKNSQFGIISNSLDKYIYGRTTSGATNNIAYKKKVLQELTGFDESYIFCYEDVDLKWRFRLKGYKRIFCPDMIIWHPHENDIITLKKKAFLGGVGVYQFFIKYLFSHPFIAIGSVGAYFYYLPFSIIHFINRNPKLESFNNKIFIMSLRSYYAFWGFFYALTYLRKKEGKARITKNWVDINNHLYKLGKEN